MAFGPTAQLRVTYLDTSCSEMILGKGQRYKSFHYGPYRQYQEHFCIGVKVTFATGLDTLNSEPKKKKNPAQLDFAVFNYNFSAQR